MIKAPHDLRPHCPKCSYPGMFETLDPKKGYKVWKCMSCGHEMDKLPPPVAPVRDDIDHLPRPAPAGMELGWKDRAHHELNVLVNKIARQESVINADKAAAEEIFAVLSRIKHPGLTESLPWKAAPIRRQRATMPQPEVAVKVVKEIRSSEPAGPKTCIKCGREFENNYLYHVTSDGPVCRKASQCVSSPEGSADGVMSNSLRDAFAQVRS